MYLQRKIDAFLEERNHLTRIASYVRKAMTKLCIKILVESDSAIESAFSQMRHARESPIKKELPKEFFFSLRGEIRMRS